MMTDMEPMKEDGRIKDDGFVEFVLHKKKSSES